MQEGLSEEAGSIANVLPKNWRPSTGRTTLFALMGFLYYVFELSIYALCRYGYVWRPVALVVLLPLTIAVAFLFGNRSYSVRVTEILCFFWTPGLVAVTGNDWGKPYGQSALFVLLLVIITMFGHLGLVKARFGPVSWFRMRRLMFRWGLPKDFYS